MKLKLHLLAGAALCSLVPLCTWAQPDASASRLGAEKAFNDFTKIQIRNFQDESLGRMMDLGIDLVNGRIVEVLVVTDRALSGDRRIVAVPPLAFMVDPVAGVYRLNASTETFKSAAAIDLAQWTDWNRSDRIAAAYRHFGQEPYFLLEGETSSPTAERPKVPIGYVERSSKIQDLPVGNFQGEKFGKVWSMTLDINRGRILNVIILAPGNFQTKSIVPAMALSFNAQRDALLLDDTKREFADEPRYIFTEAAYGQERTYEREPYQGPRTSVALEQGTSYRDIDRTVQINRDIRTAKVNGRNVEVGTLNGRVTLRGWVYTAEDKRRIGEIAVAAARLEVVDNQILVGKPLTAN